MGDDMNEVCMSLTLMIFHCLSFNFTLELSLGHHESCDNNCTATGNN